MILQIILNRENPLQLQIFKKKACSIDYMPLSTILILLLLCLCSVHIQGTLCVASLAHDNLGKKQILEPSFSCLPLFLNEYRTFLFYALVLPLILPPIFCFYSKSFNFAKRGSISLSSFSSSLHLHSSTFKSAPHPGHNPLQSSLQSNFWGRSNAIASIIIL